ncbi:hypothetical protein V6Z11_1Z143300 [Gossypium hirsutum]
MEEIECKPPTQLIVEASISSTDHPEKNNSGEALSPSCSNILTKIHAALLWKILTQPNGVSRDVLQCFQQAPIYGLFAAMCLAALNTDFTDFGLCSPMLLSVPIWLALLQSAPILLQNSSLLHMILCWTFIVPLAMLDIKIYGQWFTTEKLFLSVMANPTSLISVIGNLVAARAAAQMGWKESAVCMWSLGMVHYLVLSCYTLSRLSGQILSLRFYDHVLLVLAAPSMGSLAWNSITGTFDTTSKMLFFFSLSSSCLWPFLFKKSMRKFNVAWWAYSFPLTFLAMAAVEYSREVKCHVATLLMLLLSVVSVSGFLGLMMLTALTLTGCWKSNAGATTK